MALRIGFFQYELSHPGNAPHVGMCLLLDDLRRAGHAVDAALVRAGAVDALADRIREAAYDFVALDSIFTAPLVRRLKERCPETPILLGGTNALSLFLCSPADWAIVGAAREAMGAFARAFEAGALPGDVPNLWHRGPGGSIDLTAAARDWQLDAELASFDPDLEWDYVGGPRDGNANLRFPSVVPELGCAFGADSMNGDAYAALPRGEAPQVLAAVPLSNAARDAIVPLLDNTRGCAFCAFRFQTHVSERAEEAAARAVAQMARLAERYGIREFSVQSEHPFAFLPALIDRIRADALPVERLLVRTFPIVLARNPQLVRRGLAAAAEAGITLHLQQLGFENFVADELDHLGKAIKVEENVRAARLLFELDREFPRVAHLFGGHGFILFTPWTRPEDVVENVRVVREEAPFLADSLTLLSRLCFYDPFNPIYRLAERQGLTMTTARDYGLDFRFADDRTERLTRLAILLERRFLEAGEEAGPALSRAVLTGAAPLFTGETVDGRDPKAAAALFAEAEARARDNLARDRELWPEARSRRYLG